MSSSSGAAIADWALPPNGKPPGEDQNLWDRITAWWAEFTLQTKLLAIATLVVSLMMTGITFFALNGIQRDAVMNDTRYARDLGLLLAGNVTELVAQGQDRELANVAEKFWRSSRSVRYIFFADPDGVIYLGIPISGSEDGSSADMRLSRRLELPDELRSRPQNPLVRQHITPQGQDRELADVAEKFWRSSRSVRYIFFADPEGVVYLGIPISATPSSGDGELRLNRRLELPDELRRRPQNPLVRQHLTPQGAVTDVFVPLIRGGQYYGVLGLGVNPNETALASAALTREVTVAVFISIWVLVILGAVFNALTITRPVKELLRGGALRRLRQLRCPGGPAGGWGTGGIAHRVQRHGLPARGL